MAISIGDKLPETTFTTMTGDGPSQMSTADVFNGRKVAVFAVPGAFTPTCHQQHLPGFLANADALKAKGVDTIACISVNDVFVMAAWAETTKSNGKILFLADGSADFTKAVGMELDASAFGMGIRSQRYAMLVEDGVVQAFHNDEVPTSADGSSAEKLLAGL